MHRMKKAVYSVAMIVLTLFFIGGCTSVGLPKGAAAKEKKQPDTGWWYAGFQINWPEDAEPSWYVDTMIAHRVIYPVLNQYKEKIGLWRFHRRAARDKSGHQFSFIFYASSKAADRIYRTIRSNPDLVRLKSSCLVVREIDDDTSKIDRPNIEDTSDKAWSAPVKKSWPYFIMGVSEMWLNLILEYAGKEIKENEPIPLGTLQDYYRQIHRSVEEMWAKEGGHALLHHLNAVFGYEPVLIKTHPMRF